MTQTVEQRYEWQRTQLERRGQEHLLRWWEELDDASRRTLLTDLESIPWARLDPVIPTHVLAKPRCAIPSDIKPANVYPRSPKPHQQAQYREARHRGVELLEAAKVAAFTVAGGQGTRLGVDGPKGMVAVTPVGDRTLFQLFAETVLSARAKYETPIPWYVMTSLANHAETAAFLDKHSYFGLPKEDVMLFSQGMLPAFGHDGRILLEGKDRLALAPDGHGGSLTALVASQALADARLRGVDILSYFQIDNPLVKPFDPLFIGLHAMTNSDMSTKVAAKADDLEKVGNVCRCGGKVTVIEYSDFPEDRAHARDEVGNRLFNAGNLAIHLINVDFVDRVAGQSFELPFRRAEKKVPYVNDDGESVEPETPNAVKLETFVFDVLPLATNPLVLEVDRSEEFSPVKNRTGVDSLESSRRDQVLRAVQWLKNAGVDVPESSDGAPAVTVAISPRFALDQDDVIANASSVPPLHTGDAVYIE